MLLRWSDILMELLYSILLVVLAVMTIVLLASKLKFRRIEKKWMRIYF